MGTTARLFVVATLVTLSSCGFNDARFKETRTISRTAFDAMPLYVSSNNGSIEIERNDIDNEVRIIAMISARTQERLDAVEIVADDLGNGVFEIHALWPENKRKSNEGVSYEITYPQTSDVRLTTSNGSLTIGDFAGKIDLRTSNGRITVDGHEGDVVADTSNGSIKLYDISGAVSADTSNGSVIVELTSDNPGPVALDSSNGSITLEVGHAFAGELEADTSNGRIKVHGTVEGRIYSISRNHVRLALGDAENFERSSIDTSNGSVTIRIRD
jgi:DUF4097 and DUF4098 domain-containing protein YvlB